MTYVYLQGEVLGAAKSDWIAAHQDFKSMRTTNVSWGFAQKIV